MGLLVEGKWHATWYDTKKSGGSFERSKAAFRNWVTQDGSAGPSGREGFKAEAGRYHLYVSWACPWAHRTLIFRELKGLTKMVSLSAVNSYMPDESGWTFHEGDDVIKDPIINADFMHQIYTEAKSDFSGRVTVPVLWCKKTNTIVSNESSEIIRMFNSAFDEIGAKEGDYYPKALRHEIDDINTLIYENINNGVYRCGFATTQEAYENAYDKLFSALDKVEDRLSTSRYLVGDKITEADWRLFTTLVRFDPVYVGHFKCNQKRLIDYENLWNYCKELYQVKGVAETCKIENAKKHYYMSHTSINPTRVVPKGPEVDFAASHNRGS